MNQLVQTKCSLATRVLIARRELPRTVSVAWLLARREIVSEWRSSRLSILWPLLYPVAYTTLFVALRPSIQSGAAPFSWMYVLHVFIGFSLWQLWFEGMRKQMDAVRSNRSLLSRADLSPASVFLAGFLVQIAHLVPRLILAIVAVGIFLGFPSPFSVVIFLTMSIFLVVNGCAIGFVMQPFSTLLPDLGKIVQSVSLALLVSGGVFVILPPDVNPMIVKLLAMNPLGPLIEAARAPMLGQAHVFEWAAYIWSVLTVIALLLQFVIAKKVLPVLLERIGG
ncbi:MAG: ABC transporter permease [Porticoccaceae bacterium]